MTTPTTPDRITTHPAVRRVLDGVRARVRRYVVADSLALALTWLGVAFWTTLGIDWFFEPPTIVRVLMLAVVGFGLLAIIARQLVDRLTVPLDDARMAMLLERRHPELNDALLTAVVLGSRENEPGECSPAMFERTAQEAADRAEHMHPARVFNARPLLTRIAAAVLLVLSVAMYVGVEPRGFGVWARRCLALSDRPWPRFTRLAVEGFGDDGTVKVARGRPFELRVKADTRWPVVPRTVDLDYRAEGGPARHELMTRLGGGDPRRTRFQRYGYKFESVLAPVDLSVRGGDARLDGLRLIVVENPALHRMTLRLRLPKYIDRPKRSQPVTGVMLIPRGTSLTVEAEANKPLRQVDIQFATSKSTPQADNSLSESPNAPQADNSLSESHGGNSASKNAGQARPLNDADRDPITLTGNKLGDDRRRLSFDLPALMDDETLLVSLLDEDGIATREPISVRLAAVADAAPELAVRLAGIGSAVTPDARLPVAGEVRDDWGVARLWFEYAIDDGPPERHTIRHFNTPPTTTEVDAKTTALELPELALEPGQRLTLSVRAADLHNLDGGPNVGKSDRWTLEVVTPEQLRALLESRELVLRQRFETIIRDVTETRDLLARLEFDADADESDESDPDAADADEDGDQLDGDAAPPNRRELAVERTIQNTRKSTQETAAVVESFHDIVRQTVNNRIDTSELRGRLVEGIVEPLEEIVDRRFPELDRRLQAVQESIDDAELGPQRRGLARREADAVLLQMQRVLDRMVELEDFNEAIEALRQIIAMQEDLREQTQRRRKARLEELLQ